MSEAILPSNRFPVGPHPSRPLKKNEERLSQIPLSRIIFYIPIEFIAIWPISFYGNKDPFFLLVLLIFIRQV
jgi:hypothetical protein